VAFGKDGEWVHPRMLVTQWQGVTGHDVAELNDLKKWVVVWPPEYKSGDLVYPYSNAKK
jgi:branched-chain amino acid transport system substrate-binding protein